MGKPKAEKIKKYVVTKSATYYLGLFNLATPDFYSKEAACNVFIFSV